MIKDSSVPKAGMGVFATVFIPKGTRFGPYDGIIETNRHEVQRAGYGWEVCFRYVVLNFFLTIYNLLLAQ